MKYICLQGFSICVNLIGLARCKGDQQKKRCVIYLLHDNACEGIQNEVIHIHMTGLWGYGNECATSIPTILISSTKGLCYF